MRFFFLLAASIFFQFNSAAQCWQDVETGYYHALAIDSNGGLWVWGSDSLLQLGLPSSINQNLPVRIDNTNDWKQASGGWHHSVAIKKDGTLWAWGSNGSGQLGDGTFEDRNLPVQIGTDNDWKQVSAGGFHTVAIKNDGTLWAWGSNVTGQIGDGSTETKNYPVKIGASTNWKQVSAGERHTLAVKTNGTLWAWGNNTLGELGIGWPPDYLAIPVQVNLSISWEEVHAGQYHNVAMRTNGTLWAWGYNSRGQLGDGTTTERDKPVQSGSASDWNSVAVPAGWYTHAIKNDGTLWAWGQGVFYQLGNGSNADSHVAIQIGTDSDWFKMASGVVFSVALKQDGSLWSWGRNDYGQLADGTFVRKTTPVPIACPITATDSPESPGFGVEISPNPAQDILSVDIAPSDAGRLQAFVSNVLGERLVVQTNLESHNELDVSHLSPGVYFLTVGGEQGVITRQIMKL